MKPIKHILRVLTMFLALVIMAGCGAAETPEPSATELAYEQRPTVQVGAMKGPTGIGMAQLMQQADQQQSTNQYTFALAGSPDEMVTKIINGEVDVAAIPVNLAATLYNKTGGQVQMIAVNTLGVLYILENGQEIQSVEDLRGKTLYATGQGATPEYILYDILTKNGLIPGEDVTIEYKAEHAELATLMSAGQVVLGMLPEPNVTAVLSKNPEVRVALNLTEEFARVNDTQLVQGCLVARAEFAQQHPDTLSVFLQEYQQSVAFVNQNVQDAAQLVAQYEILPSAEVAAQAIPKCNIVYLDGQDMADQAEPMLQLLFEANPSAVGGALPGEALYYIP